ncbi:MAG: DNA cytosine methyltransferase [Gilliamella sp.]|nr:DNA cytosine methyltransferase [Gilliamella sp.]
MNFQKKFSHIELFAGCGGLSLGLDKAGFELMLANELSPMAAETFAYNFFNENFEQLAKKNEKPKKIFWLSSLFDTLAERLRENPFNYPSMGKGFCDIPNDKGKLKNSLIIGNITELNHFIENDKEFLFALKSAFNDTEVDLISGGPPCQSFSMAGLREKDNDKNTLPWEFANFVAKIQPKVVLLENVTGILRAFKDKDGSLYHAWFEVAKVFATKKYVPLCLHVNARFTGVPQNRPRFIMLAIRHDIFLKLNKKFLNGSSEETLFLPSINFYISVKRNVEKVNFGSLPYFDVSIPDHFKLFQTSFLKYLVNHKEVNVKSALDDLKINNPRKPSLFVRKLNAEFADILRTKKEISNHELRNNSQLVKCRFRIYQILQQCSNRDITNAVFNILKGKESKLPENIWEKLKKFEYLQDNNQMKAFSDKADFEEYLKQHPTKKQTQKALNADSPAPAALSIPDDACHYDEKELRVLTVREMARIQSFPDNFVFRSKITTGGQMRKFEVPQYTQVGNAVPPLLGLALGKSVAELLRLLEK